MGNKLKNKQKEKLFVSADKWNRTVCLDDLKTARDGFSTLYFQHC